MNKVVAGFVVAVVAALMSFGFMSSAQADYGDSGTSPTSVSPPTVSSVSDSGATTASALPNTGGPNETVFAGGLALLAAGGFSIWIARRRQTN